MPLQYATGTVAEHLACRHDAVVFDVSHLGTVRCDGAGMFDAVPGDPDERPQQGRPGSRAVHAPADRRRLRRRRHHRVVGGRKRVRRHAQRLQHLGRAPRRCPAVATSPPSAACSRSRGPSARAKAARRRRALWRGRTLSRRALRLPRRRGARRRHGLHRRGRTRDRRAQRSRRRDLSRPGRRRA